ncbi:MAG: response regulator [Acidobacteria bacterium]|nr:response regulator [Acidobacteriaceae bacterium]MBV9609824.1 response regulator [Acidobacteriota bacterium]
MKTILLADDEESLRALVEMTLECSDIRILHAATGEAALDVARREHPDLMLLDWRMPAKSGIDVARELRADPKTADIVIVMLTAMGSEEDRRQGFDLGVRAYLVKPFSPLVLLECVQELLTPAIA